MSRIHASIAAAALLWAASPAAAQSLEIGSWTISAGVGTCAGGRYVLTAAIGQPDAGTMTAGTLALTGGFWVGAPDSCYPDCEEDRQLDLFDFLCFQNAFLAGDPYACACDLSTGRSVCDLLDLLCFQNHYLAGCP